MSSEKIGEMVSRPPPKPRPQGARPFVLEHTLPEAAPAPETPSRKPLFPLIRPDELKEVVQWFRKSRAAPWLGFVLWLFVWMVGIEQKPGGWILTHYIALAATCCCLCEAIRRRWIKRPFRRAWYLLPIAVVLFAYGKYDSYTTQWTSVRPDYPQKEYQLDGRTRLGSELWKTAGRTEYSDTRKRWGGRLSWRSMWSYQKGENGVHYGRHAEGAMAGEKGKPHGYWHGFGPAISKVGDSDVVNFREDRWDKWYWYGEEISEGEWELRK